MLIKVRELSGAYNGLAQKIKFIKSCYQSSLLDPRVRRFAEQAAGRGDRLTQVKNLYDALKARLVYTPDPVGIEYTKSPSRHLDDILSTKVSYGDCDDHACVAYSMLQMIGIPAKLRVTWYDKSMPQHIYTMAQVSGKWYPFDTTKRSGFGKEAPYSKARDF